MEVLSKSVVKVRMGLARGLTLWDRPSHSHSADAQTGVQLLALASRGEHRIIRYTKV